MTTTDSQSALQAQINRIFAPLLSDAVSPSSVVDAHRAFRSLLLVHIGKSRQQVMRCFLVLLRKKLMQIDSTSICVSSALREIFVTEIHALAQSPVIDALDVLRDVFPIDGPMDAPVSQSDGSTNGEGKWKTPFRKEPRQEVCDASAIIEAEQWVVTLIQWSEWSVSARILLAMALMHSEASRASCIGLYLLYKAILPVCGQSTVEGLRTDVMGFLVDALLRPVTDNAAVKNMKEVVKVDGESEAKQRIFTQYERIASPETTRTPRAFEFDLFDCLQQIGNQWTDRDVLEKFFRRIAHRCGFSAHSVAKTLWKTLLGEFQTVSPEDTKARTELLNRCLLPAGTNSVVWGPFMPATSDTAVYVKLLIDAFHATMRPEPQWESILRALDMPSFALPNRQTYDRLCLLLEYCLTKADTTHETDSESLTREALERRLLLSRRWTNRAAQIEWIRFAFLTTPDGATRKWFTDEAVVTTLVMIGESSGAQHIVREVFRTVCTQSADERVSAETSSNPGLALLHFLFRTAKGLNESLCSSLISDLFCAVFTRPANAATSRSKEDRTVETAALFSFIEAVESASKQSEQNVSFMHHTIPSDDDTRWMRTLAAALLSCVRKGAFTIALLLSIVERIPDSAFVTEVLTQAPCAIAFAVFAAKASDRHMPAVRGWVASTFFEPQRTESFLHPGGFIHHAARWVEQKLSVMRRDDLGEHSEKLHAMLGVLSSPFASPQLIGEIEGIHHRLEETLRAAELLDGTLIPHPVLFSEDTGDALRGTSEAHAFSMPLPTRRELSPDECQRKKEIQARKDSEERRMIEETAASMIQQLFAGNLSPDTFLSSLAETKRRATRRTRDLLQESRDRKETNVPVWRKPLNQRQAKALYSHIVDLLWNECPKFVEYPESELHIAVKVMGGVILYDLFPTSGGDTKTITALLKFVLQSIAKPKKPTARKFAIRVLAVFLSRVPQWPQYCKHLQALVQTQSIGKELKESMPNIPSVVGEVDPEDTPERVARTEKEWDTAGMAFDRRSISKRLALLDESGLVLPPPGIRHRVAFLLNNLDTANVDQHALEIAPLLETPPTALLFFARYLVEKRIVSEPNYHKSYVTLLERIGNRVFEKIVLSVSYCATHRCLANDSVRTSSSERSTLKNLGAWIGLITLSRDRPIIARELNVQALLLEGLAKGKLIAIVPFIAKLLEGIVASRVFTVQSPWVFSIFVHIIEISSLANIKVNIRFELEMLCKKMNIVLSKLVGMCDAHPSWGAIRSAVEEVYRGLDVSSSVDFTAPLTPSLPKGKQQIQHGVDGYRQKGIMSPQNDIRNPPRTPQTVVAPSDRSSLCIKPEQPPMMQPNWMENLGVIQSLVPPFRVPTNVNSFLQAKRIALASGSPKLIEAVPSVIASVLKLAVEVAVKEVLLPVVERSVVIATNTTRELIRKDFAFDSDDQLLEGHVKAMVRALASSLAVVTAKEPLRASTRRTLQSSILSSFAVHTQGGVAFSTVGHDDEGKGTLPSALVHEFIDLILQDNKEGLGVLELVERVAAESATNRIGEFCTNFAEERRQNRRVLRAVGAQGLPVPGGQPHPFTAALPRDLRANDGIQGPQKDIYDDFMRFSVFRGPIADVKPEKSVTKVLEQLNSLIGYIETEAVRHYKENPRQYLSLTQPEFASSTLSPSHEHIKKCLYLVPDLVKLITDDAEVLQLVHFTYRNLVSMTNSMGSTAVSSAEIIQRLQAGVSDNSAPIPTGALILNLIHESYLLILQSAKERMSPRQGELRDKSSNAVIAAVTRLFVDDEQCWELKDLCVGFIRLRLIDVPALDAHVQRVLVRILEDGDGGGLFAAGQRAENGPLNYTPQTRAIVEFAGGLVQSCLVDEKITSQKELKGTLQALEAVAGEAQRQQKAYLKANGQRKAVRVRVPTYFAPRTTKHRVFVWNILEDWRQHQAKWDSPRANETERDALRAAMHNGLRMGKRPVCPEEHVVRYVEKITGMCTTTTDFTASDFFQLAIESAVTEFATHHGSSAGHAEGVLTPAEAAVGRRALDAIDSLSEMILGISYHDHPFWRVSAADNSIFSAFFEGLNATLRANHGHFTGAMRDCPCDAVSGPYPSTRDTVTQHEFQQQPYFRLLSNLLCAQHRAGGSTEETPLKYFPTHLAGFLHQCSPQALPGFTFAWVSLTFHRLFLPALLLRDGLTKGTMPTSTTGIPTGWTFASELLTTLLTFLGVLLKSVNRAQDAFPPHVGLLYTATLRGMLVLLHDFPEFLCVHADTLCAGLPVHCVQLRNVILSAFPRTVRLPDPFTPNLKVDLLPESAHVPLVEENYFRILRTVRLSEKSASPDGTLADCIQSVLQRKIKTATAVQHIMTAWRETGQNASKSGIVPASVLSIALAVIGGAPKSPEQGSGAAQEALSFFSTLCVLLERSERFGLLNALVDQLRYPNRLTLYCSFVLLSLFSLTEEDVDRINASLQGIAAKRVILSIQEQITRVLFQRLIGNRPHPWGLLITFIELVKNPRYAFWKKPYVHNSTPALRKLFESVGHSCAPQGPSDAIAAPE